MGQLRESDVKTLTTPGRHADGGGLYLRIAPAGQKSWVLRIKGTDKGVGGWPAVSLRMARTLADSMKVAIRSGEDLPVKVKAKVKAKASTAPTFKDAAGAVLREKVRHSKITSDRSALQWTQRLERHAMPTLGNRTLASIDTADVLEILEPLWTSHFEAAKKLTAQFVAVFDWGTDYGHLAAGADPMLGVGRRLKRWATRPPVQHYRALASYADVPDVLQRLRTSRHWYLRSTDCLELVILSACRSGEARGATWGEIDLNAGVWAIPAERMKASRPHRVPLSIQAAVLLRTRKPADAAPDALVFPSAWPGKVLSDNTLGKRLRGEGIASTVHGFRSSFRNWAAEVSGASRDAIELSLAHTVGNQVERAYFTSDLLDARRDLMQAWASFIDPLVL